jgi:hypothetical protein
MKESSNETLFTRIWLSLFTTTSIGLVLSTAIMRQTFPNYLYELYQRILALNLAFLLTIIAAIYSINIKSCLNQSLISKVLFVSLLYVTSFKALTLFSNEYLTNPFDTTGLRGFIEDLIMNGRVPQKGFYVEYAGAYDTLPVGPILTSIMYIVMDTPNSITGEPLVLDNFLKFTETIIAFYCIFVAYVFAKRLCIMLKELGIYRNRMLQIIILILIVLLSLNPVLTLQTYAWPYLLLLHFIFFNYIMYERFKYSSMLAFIITLTALLNAHSVSNLLNTIFFSLLFLVLSIKYFRKRILYNNVEKREIIAIVFIVLIGFFIKFFYNAVKYGRTFLTVGLDLIKSLLQLEVKLPTQVQSLEHVSIHLSITDYISLYLFRLHGTITTYLIITLMIVYGCISMLLSKRTSQNYHNDFIALTLLYTSFTLINLLLTAAILLSGGNLYTATAHMGILIIVTLPLLSLTLFKMLRNKALLLILIILLAVGLLFGGNWLNMPKIDDQPLIAYTVNTPYKVKVALFLRETLSSCSRETSSISSDIVTGWQIMGYAPSLYECYVWRDPIIEGNVISKYIVLPISVKAGYLNEPLTYRLTAFQKIYLYVLVNNLTYNDGGVVVLVKS